MTRRYAVFDQAHLGSQLDVTRGGIVLTTLAPGLNISRTGRCDVPAQDFESIAEFVVYGNAGTSIANRVSIGVVTADADLNDYVGADEFGVGYRLGEGQIRHNGSTLDSATVGALGDIVGVRFTPVDAAPGLLTWYLNGAPAAEVSLPPELDGQPLFLACSIGSDLEPGDLEIMVNSGRDNFWFPVAGQDAGWWEAPALPGTLRFGDAPYISGRGENVPYVRFEGGITENRVVDERGVHFWIWGGASQARGSAAIIEILDSEGRIDDALGLVYRDQPATLRIVDPETGYDAGHSLGSFIVERIEATGPLARKVTLRGPLASFEVPLLRLAVRPDADENAVGHYYPALIGPGFSCPVRLLNQASRIYAIDSIGVAAVGKVRDQGVALDPNAPDYVIRNGGREVELLSEPFGTVTVDAAASGGAIIPPGSTDVLGGEGNPFVGVGGVGTFPDGWTAVTAAKSGYEPYVDSSGRLFIPHPDQAWTQVLKHDTAVLEAGKSYILEIAVDDLWFHPTASSSISMLYAPSNNAPYWWSLYTALHDPNAGVYAGGVLYPPLPQVLTYRITPSADMDLLLRWRVQTTMLPPFTPTTAAIIRHIKLTELPPPEDGTEDELEAEIAAAALPLAEIMSEVIENRCGLPGTLWNRASAEAIDAATGFIGQGYWTAEQAKLRDVIDTLLRGYMASAFEAADGRLTFARLVDPETVSPDGVDITDSDVLNDALPEADEMPGLTCSIGCRRNEHVFSADELGDALPWAARPKLTRQYRYVRRYGGPLAPGLEHARAAETLDSRLVSPADSQAMADHVGQLAQIPRAFFSIRVPNPGRWEVAQVCRLYLPRWFKDGGGWRNVYIVSITNGRQDVGTLRVWTRAPWAQ